MLAFLLVAFLIACISMCWMIVRFKTPRWLVLRR